MTYDVERAIKLTSSIHASFISHLKNMQFLFGQLKIIPEWPSLPQQIEQCTGDHHYINHYNASTGITLYCYGSKKLLFLFIQISMPL